MFNFEYNKALSQYIAGIATRAHVETALDNLRWDIGNIRTQYNDAHDPYNDTNGCVDEEYNHKLVSNYREARRLEKLIESHL